MENLQRIQVPAPGPLFEVWFGDPTGSMARLVREAVPP
jgi:hypothetical protein